MAPMPRSEFVRLVRGLGAEAFETFVADVWRARGRTVRHDVDGIVATDPETGETELLRPAAWDAAPPTPAQNVGPETAVDRTVLVTVRAATGNGTVADSTITADGLHRVLQYALPAEAADRIARSHFDRPFHRSPPTESPPDPSGSEPRPSGAGGLIDALTPESTSRGFAIAGAVLLLLAGVIGVTATQIGPTEPPTATTPSTADPAGEPMAGQTPTAVPSGPESTAADRENRHMADVAGEHEHLPPEEADRPEALPPGLAPTGIEDADRLAASHARALEGRSYRLEIIHRESVDGRATGLAREEVLVASPAEYRSIVERVGRLRGDPLVVADRSAYADGEFRYEQLIRENRTGYVRTSPTPLRDGLHGRDRYLLRTSAYVRWFLSVEDSWIAGTTDRDGVQYFWVVTEGEPFPGYPNAQGSAIIDEHGVVHEIHRTYDEPGRRSGEIAITIRYTRFGNITVTPPPWADEARNQVGPDDGPATTTAPSTAAPSNASEAGSGATRTATTADPDREAS